MALFSKIKKDRLVLSGIAATAALCLAGPVNAQTLTSDLGTVYQAGGGVPSTVFSIGVTDTGNVLGAGPIYETIVMARDANGNTGTVYNTGVNTAEADTNFTAALTFTLVSDSIFKIMAPQASAGTLDSLALYDATGTNLLGLGSDAIDHDITGLPGLMLEKTLAAGSYLLVTSCEEDASLGYGSFNEYLYASAITITPPDTTPVPEPGTIALLGLGLGGLAVYGKRRQSNTAKHNLG